MSFIVSPSNRAHIGVRVTSCEGERGQGAPSGLDRTVKFKLELTTDNQIINAVTEWTKLETLKLD